MTPDELIRHLERLEIEVERHRHPPLHTVEESRRLRGDLPGTHCKNLFLRDKKKRSWLLVTLEDQAVDLAQMAKRVGAGRFSFGRPERLMEVLGIEPGAVSPLALVNDPDHRVSVVLDEEMMRSEWLNYHPLTNEQTVTIRASGLRRFLDDTGHRVLEVSFL